MSDILKVGTVFSQALEKSVKAKEQLNYTNVIALCPLWAYMKGGADKISETMVLPVSPSEVMFTNDSDSSTIKLINYGELPVSMNRKLSTWSVSSVFLKQFNNNSTYYEKTDGGLVSTRNRYWFDYSNENGQSEWDVYGDYCSRLYNWKENQTPLVFIYKTWGDYYYCQIKTFKFGNKDSTGNVYYELQFQEYKKYTKFDSSYASTDYESDTYYCDETDTLLTIAKKMYGSTSYFNYLMNLNNLDNPTVVKGQAIKLR